MKARSFVFLAAGSAMLAACVEMEPAAPPPEVTPPEFFPCRQLPDALAKADAIVRSPPAGLSAQERTYWVDRQDRLIKRAWECKG